MSQETINSNEDLNLNKKISEEPMTEERMAELSNKYDIKPEKPKEEQLAELVVLRNDFIKEIERVKNSQSTREQIDTTALGKMVQAFGAIDENEANYFVHLVKETFSDAPYRSNIIPQVETIINYYRGKGQVKKLNLDY
jgi:hypothetical protein